MKKEVKENKMGTMPVGKLLLTMAFPMMLSMLIQALYNIVDGIFVGKLSEDALTAVSMAFPIQNLIIAVGAGTGVGINALLSRSLGEKNQENVNASALNGIFLTLISYIGFAIFGLFFTRAYFESQTSISLISEEGTTYLSLCLIFSIGALMQMTFERLLQSTGKTLYTMITQGIGAIINIILDPILIFGLGGCPAMGIKGAAIATVIGQCVAMGLAIWFNYKKNHEINFSLKGFKIRKDIIVEIYKVGIPSIIMMAIGSIMVYALNTIVGAFSTTAVAVLGIYMKLQNFVFMPVFGLNNALIPIISYNYGGRDKERIIKAIRYALVVSIGIMFVGSVIFQCFPKELLSLFGDSSDIIVIGVPALRTISLCFVFAGYCIIVGSVFQALGNGMMSLIVSVARQLLAIVPIAYLLAKYVGPNAVWASFPMAEMVSVAVSTLFFVKIYREKISSL